MSHDGWAVDLGLLCGCNYVGVEIPLKELPISLFWELSSVARRGKTGGD